MDSTIAEKIGALAKSLKELHLAATMDEATERARDIILGSEEKQLLSKAHVDLNFVKDQLKHHEHAPHDDVLKGVHETIDKSKKRSEDLKEIIELAKQLQD